MLVIFNQTLNKRLCLVAILCFTTLFQQLVKGQSVKPKKQVPIIFNTDIGPDYDDIGAIALLHATADSGECKILATIASNNELRQCWI